MKKTVKTLEVTGLLVLGISVFSTIIWIFIFERYVMLKLLAY